MRRMLGFVDGFIRGRRELIERVRTGDGLGSVTAGAVVMYLAFTLVYGFGMGSFRWAHPLLFFSDFEIGSAQRGRVDTMDAAAQSFSTCDLRAAPELVGKTVRFNRTNPTPAYTITRTEQAGPHCVVHVEGPPMVAEAPWRFAFLAAVKVPALFLVTLLVCLPALYVLNVAMGWKLSLGPTAAVLIFAVAGTSVMLAVFAPVVIFFTVLTDHYHFMMILHVLIFVLAGAYGVQTLAVGLEALRQDAGPPGDERRPNQGRLIAAWLVLYMFVGCQMAWSLKPWVGTPYIAEFEALRPSSTNFYAHVLGSLRKIADARR